MSDTKSEKQRDYMRKLVKELGSDQAAVCKAYALAELEGKVRRDKNESRKTPEQYAAAL